MEERITKMEEQLERIEKSIDKITFYLYSDSSTNRKGLAEKIVDLEVILNDVITREKIFKAKATVWGMVGAALVSIAWKVVTIIMK